MEKAQGVAETTLAKTASPALMANGLLVAGLLIDRRTAFAIAVSAGCGISILIYGSLISVMDRVFAALLAGPRQEYIKSTSNRLVMAFLVVGKFVAVGALMYLFFSVLHMNIGAFVLGFLVAQCFVSVGVYRRLSKSKVTE